LTGSLVISAAAAGMEEAEIENAIRNPAARALIPKFRTRKPASARLILILLRNALLPRPTSNLSPGRLRYFRTAYHNPQTSGNHLVEIFFAGCRRPLYDEHDADVWNTETRCWGEFLATLFSCLGLPCPPMRSRADKPKLCRKLRKTSNRAALPMRSSHIRGQDMHMAYMDVPPAGTPNGRTVVLLHGMNFGGFYFGGPIEVLRNTGFRVVVPDQIGFGRSSKPIIPYNFHDMARNTRKLLESPANTKAAIVGHSMGWMLAARFAASYPDITERLVIYNLICLTDPRYQTPWRTADDAYKAAMAQSHDQIYQAFYAIYQQITYLDPVVYDWPKIRSKTLVLGGDKDGPDFPVRAKHVADTIPGTELVLIPNAGHVPHIEVPEIFNRELLKFLQTERTRSGNPNRSAA
jgi:pimeloyl-ACP methyl ester carboxylesterase